VLLSHARPQSLPPFSWTSGEIHAEVLAGAGLLATVYAIAWARGPRGSRIEPLAFLVGLGALLAALNGPLHDLSDYYLFSAHMVQHLVLTLIVPPLLLAGTPGWMLDRLLAPLLRWQLGRSAVRLTRPVPALALYAVALIVWHLPGPYNAALAATLAPRLHYGAQILYLFAFGIPMTVVASMITGAERVLYPFYAAAPRPWDLTPLADQRLGGVIMWVPAGLIPLVAFTVVFFRWVAAESDDDSLPAGKRLL
jgi:putative membrane protein